MTNILLFPRKMAPELSPPGDVYPEPTADEARQIIECLERIEGHILVLRQELVTKQSQLAAANWGGQQLLKSVDCNQEHLASRAAVEPAPWPNGEFAVAHSPEFSP